MKSPDNFRRVIMLLAVICLFTRLIFIFGKTQIPVMWDARIYSSAALGLIHSLTKGGQFAHSEKLTVEDSSRGVAEFRNCSNKYISGEQIQWLYYGVPNINQAQENIFISGPVYPVYLGILIFISPVSDFMVIRIFNILLDTLCLILVLFVAKDLFGRMASIFAGVIYILYLPFILLTGMISTDQVTITLILLSFSLMLQWYRKDRDKYVYLSGLMLGLLVLTKPTASFLFIIFAVAIILENKDSLKRSLITLGKASLPFAAVVLPWLIGTSLYFGTPAIRDPRYSEANFRSSSSIKYEGYDLDFVEKDFWLYPVSYTIQKDPVGYSKLLVKKFVRLWGQPYNDFKQSFIMTPATTRYLHLLIVITGIFAISAFLVLRSRGSMLLAIIPIYYTLVHLVFHSLARYNLIAMPLVIIGSSFVISGIVAYIQEHYRSSRKRIFMISSIPLLGLFYFSAITPGQMAQLLDKQGVNFYTAIGIFVIASVLVALYFVLRHIHGNKKSVLFLQFPFVIFALITLVSGSAPENWAEWKCRLTEPTQAAAVDIYIPKDFRLAPTESVRLWLDLSGVPATGKNIAIMVSGQSYDFTYGQLPLNRFYYNKPTYRIFSGLGALDPEQVRYWSYIPFSTEAFNYLADKDGFIRVMVTPADSAVGAPNQIDLYGNFNSQNFGEALVPDLERSSIERYIEKGDPRVWIKYPLSSDSAISYYIENIEINSNSRDLSLLSGKQIGRYRIYIEVRRADQRYYHF